MEGLPHAATESEVAKLHGAVLCEENVGSLQVAMDATFRMHVVYSHAQLSEHRSNPIEIYRLVFQTGYHMEQITLFSILHSEYKLVLVPEKVMKFDDVGVTREIGQGRDLTEHVVGYAFPHFILRILQLLYCHILK